MRFEVSFRGTARLRGDGAAAPDPSALEAFLDRVMEVLTSRDVIDPEVGATLSKGDFEIGCRVEAGGPSEAVAAAQDSITEAIDGAGGFPPVWSVEWSEARAVRSNEMVEA